jgi:TorA maturation chaperone TorD
MGSPRTEPTHETGIESRLRAGTYSLLANLLSAPPEQTLLQRLSGIETHPNLPRDAMSEAWSALKSAAENADLTALGDEYQALFIGLGRGEIVPYGSWYLTGFLMEKPLGDLRRDLGRLGFERPADIHEPEDHAAALCEVMAMLITDDGASFGIQKTFFETHLGSWLEGFFADLEQAKSARFYRAVARLGGEYVKLEKRYFSMLV